MKLSIEVKKFIVYLVGEKGRYSVEMLTDAEAIVKACVENEAIFEQELTFDGDAEVELTPMHKQMILELMYQKKDWSLAEKLICDTLLSELSSNLGDKAQDETSS